MTSVVDDRSGGRAPLDAGVAPGSLLVAAPGLADPNFRRTVVYVIEHRDRGTLGVVLNRPGEVSVRDVLPSWAPLATLPHAVFVGGPVESQTALCLAAVRTGEDVVGESGHHDPVAATDLGRELTGVPPGVPGEDAQAP